ncbi:hypothetical protein BJP25_21870 [Actinokineospora bangkokensis]|uniref:Aldehyde dehydrogenase domain-containing protein n=2 Tax=Actinokineospora bangkokensis TaxID=1193682 RepID=A0A1Q9LL44_9PSEU|nr:hypothetical protein BJP25_21870 [Actinokineospora bangkokensis]
MLEVAALGPNGPYRSRRRLTVPDATGTAAVDLSCVPGLVLADWVRTLRSAEPVPPDEARAVLAKAADVFEAQDVLGDSLPAHELRVATLTGTPLPVVRECDAMITAKLRDVGRVLDLATPAGAGTDVGGLRRGAVWCRRGEVFGVNAAGNSPGVHALWLEALALGYRVVVRPSTRDPLTAHRLVTALLSAGLPQDRLVLAPGDHVTADAVVEQADRVLLYGGQAVVDRYRDRADVLTQGPGRSKLVVDGDHRTGLDLAAAGVLYHAGTACTATTGVLVTREHRRFAADLADALRGTSTAAPWQDDATLPAMPVEQAEALVADVLARVEPRQVRLAPRVERVGGTGAAVLTPAVVELDDPRDPLLGHEVPFPCAFVAPFDRSEPDPLSGSLVVSFDTDDHDLVRWAVDHPLVSNAYVGHPTSWLHADVPHDGFLSEFLMRCKGFARTDRQDPAAETSRSGR